MRQFAARPAWLIAALLLAVGQVPPAAAAPTGFPAGAAALPPTPAPAHGARPVRAAAPGAQAPAPSAGDAPARDDAAGSAQQAPGGADAPGMPAPPTGDSDATPAPAPPGMAAAPREAARSRAGAIGHFRVYEHPPCSGDLCRATVSDLDHRHSFEATVSLGPMHLARQLEDSARSGQIELLLSGELRHGTGGPTLRALHLEGVTPHTPDPPAAPHAGHAHPRRGTAARPAPARPAPGLLSA